MKISTKIPEDLGFKDRKELQSWNPTFVRKFLGQSLDLAEKSELIFESTKRAHAVHGQRTRSNGEPYFNHLINVKDNALAIIANLRLNRPSCEDPLLTAGVLTILICSAILHDNIEDSKNPTRERKLLKEIDPMIESVVDKVSRKKNENYYQFIHKISKKDDTSIETLLARIVKAADLQDNLKDSEEGSRADKYRFSLDVIDPMFEMRKCRSN